MQEVWCNEVRYGTSCSTLTWGAAWPARARSGLLSICSHCCGHRKQSSCFSSTCSCRKLFVTKITVYSQYLHLLTCLGSSSFSTLLLSLPALLLHPKMDTKRLGWLSPPGLYLHESNRPVNQGSCKSPEIKRIVTERTSVVMKTGVCW